MIYLSLIKIVVIFVNGQLIIDQNLIKMDKFENNILLYTHSIGQSFQLNLLPKVLMMVSRSLMSFHRSSNVSSLVSIKNKCGSP